MLTANSRRARRVVAGAMLAGTAVLVSACQSSSSAPAVSSASTPAGSPTSAGSAAAAELQDEKSVTACFLALATFGLLHLGMIRAIGIEGKVYAGSFSVLPAALPSGRVTRRYVDFSLFPPALRDLALVMDAATPAAAAEQELAAIARAAAGGAFALESLTVFDVYQGDRLPAGQKGIAFSLVFRAPDRTLTDDEVNPVLQKIQDALARTQRYTLRK